MLMDLVIVTAPKPPGSRTLISPFAAVFEIAPANVLHGAVRLHGLASSPTPETQVRVASPNAAGAAISAANANADTPAASLTAFIWNTPLSPKTGTSIFLR